MESGDDGSHPLLLQSGGRKGSKKVRSGCITCKTRKVKCDEAKPYCRRCTDTGRKCDGYLDAAALAMRHRRRRPPVSSAEVYAEAVAVPVVVSAASASAPLAAVVPRLGPGWLSSEERRAFDFFQRITAPSLAGDLDAAFWRVLVLQVCHTEPAVRHAALAVSSLHEAFLAAPLLAVSSQSQMAGRQFALGQYNMAIGCLLEAMRSVGRKKGRDRAASCSRSPLKHPVAPLMTCVLFVCIEVMQGKDKEALLHLEKGRHILSQLARGGALDNAADPEMAVVRQHLVPLYTRLNMTSFLFGGDPVVLPTSLQHSSHGPGPDSFSSIHSLRCSLYDLVDAVLRFTQQARRAKYAASGRTWRSSSALEAEQQRLGRQLTRLRVAQTLFRVSQSAAGASATLSTAMALFEIHLGIATVWLSTALATSEMVFDAHLATFSSIVSLAASVLDAEHQCQAFSAGSKAGSYQQQQRHRQAAPSPPVVFMLETRVIPALYYVATKCRHPLVRRAALGLLRRRRGRRENLWRADTLGAIATRIVQIEEGGAVTVKGEDTPKLDWALEDEELADPAGFGLFTPSFTEEPDSEGEGDGEAGLAEIPMLFTEPAAQKQLNTEAPFDLPEGARVHTAVIGAEETGGVWTTVFRKPQGLDRAWDVQTELIAVEA